MKLEAAIQNGYQILQKNDIKTALLDSEILLSVAINKSREYIILNSNLDISNKEYIYYQIIFNGTPNNFLKMMAKSNFDFDTQNKIWILK